MREKQIDARWMKPPSRRKGRAADYRGSNPGVGSEGATPLPSPAGFRGISGNLRALGSPRNVDSSGPRGGRGKAQNETGGERPPRLQRSDGDPWSLPFVRLATERSRSVPATAWGSPYRTALWSLSRASAGLA